MKKIFKPDIMFGNRIRSCWTHNLETVDECIPINEPLKECGIFCLDIKPLENEEDDWWCFGIPINKNWESETIKSNCLSFSCITADPYTLKISVNNKNDSEIWREEVEISDIEEWKEYQVILPPILKDARLLNFSGPMYMLECLFRNIIIE